MQHVLRQTNLFGFAATAGAIVVGVAIVQEQPLILASLALLALVVVLPVEASLGLFAFSVPFDTVLVLGDSGTSLSWVAGAFAGAVLLIYLLVTGRFQAPPRSTLWWGLFSLWTAASVAWSIDPAVSLDRLPTVVCLFSLYLVAVSVRMSDRELSRVLLLLLIGGAIAGGLIVYEAHQIGFENRATLVFGSREANPNDLGDNLLLPFSLALGGVLSAGTFLRKGLLLVALLAVVTGIFLTMSRGSLIALLATLVVFLIRAGARKRMWVATLVIALPLLFLPNLFYDRLREVPTGRGTGRLDIFIAGTELVKHNPVLGVGLANFTVGYDKYAGYAPVFRGYGRAAHNAFLQVWGETGIIGLALFIVAIYMQMKGVWGDRSGQRSHDYMRVAVEAACWGLLVAAFSGNIHWSKAFWLGFILLALFTRQRQPAFELHRVGESPRAIELATES